MPQRGYTMGFLDEIGNINANAASPNTQPQVANGLIEALQEHPGGVGGLLESLRQHGLGEHVDAWTSGDHKPVDPQQVQQALGPSGLIERTAQRAGVSPQIAAMAISTLLPMVIRHFAPNGQAAPQSQIGSLAGGLLSKLL